MSLLTLQSVGTIDIGLLCVHLSLVHQDKISSGTRLLLFQGKNFTNPWWRKSQVFFALELHLSPASRKNLASETCNICLVKISFRWSVILWFLCMEQSLFHLFCWTYLSESFGKYILHVIGYLCSIFEWKDKCPILLEWPIMPLPITWSRHRQISLTHNICVSNTFKLAEHKTCPKNYTNHVTALPASN